jgi:large subunit ribosomal protein L15
MGFGLHNLSYKQGARGHIRKISGRGLGSGSTRGFKGNKGQGQRITGNVRIGFEGGQTPLYRRVAKIGFNNFEFANNFHVVTLAQIAQLKLTSVTRETLKSVIGSKKLPIKIIGSVDVKLPKLTVQVDKISAGAKKQIEEAGGTVTLAPTVVIKTTGKKSDVKKPHAKKTKVAKAK